MDEGKKEVVLLSDLPDDLNPFKDFKTISEKQVDDITIRIASEGVIISEKQVDRLIKNAHKAHEIANKINGGLITGYEKELTIRFSKKGMGGLMVDLNADIKLLKEDDESQTAAVVHEMIHGIQENDPGYDSSFPQETIPLAAEFLFSGESRKPLFLRLTEEVINKQEDEDKMSSHARGWKKAIQMLSDTMNVDVDLSGESAEKVIGKIEISRVLEDTGKIAVIKDFLNHGIGGETK